MDTDKFDLFNENWHIAANELVDAYDIFRNVKHDLEIAKANAWADGQVIGKNDMQRRAALYIITEPFVVKLVEAEKEVMRLSVKERYLRNMVDYGIWNGINNPDAWKGLRGLIDVHNK